MKKSFIVGLLFILIFALSGCAKENPNNLIKDEFIRLSELIPEEFDNDIELPSALDSFELHYYLEDIEVANFIIVYELLPENINYILALVLTYDDVEVTYYVSLRQTGNLTLLEDEMSRIRSLIPDVIEEDINLPDSSDGFDISYTVDGIISETNVIPYEASVTNKEIVIDITLSYLEYHEDTQMTLTQESDEALYYDMMFAAMIHDLSYMIPSNLISNTTLPDVNNDTLNVVYSSDCTDIVRNRIVYTFPDMAEQCNLIVQATFADGTREGSIPFEMTALSDLPKIPAIFITTVDSQEITTKEEYVSGFLTLVIEGESLFTELDNIGISIKLRGNSTLTMPKKAYKIKFGDKHALLSDYAEKKWVLLANHVDQTLLRDYLAFSMASKLDMDFSPSFTFVDVYINGVYQGNYLLTDQLEVSENRVDVEENVSDINTGFLVEYDIGLYRDGLENTDENFFLIDGIPFVIKSPDFQDDHYVEEQKTYIEDYFNTVLNTLENHGDYSNLIDEASFIDWFIVNEVFKNVDSGYSSVYFNKDKDGLLKMGPVWDFDISSGVPGYVSSDLRGPEGWWTARSDKNIFFYYLMEYPSFRQNLKTRWNEIYDNVIEVVLDETLYASDLITQSRYNNFELWDIIGKEEDWYTSPEIFDLKTYDEQVWFLYDYLKIRIEWMNDQINNFE